MNNDQEINDNSSPEEESLVIEPKKIKLEERDLNKDDIKAISNDLPRIRENTRSGLANKLLYSLIGSYISSFIILIAVITYPVDNQEEKSEIYTYSKDIMTLLISTQTGLVGTALGFYFGSRNEN